MVKRRESKVVFRRRLLCPGMDANSIRSDSVRPAQAGAVGSESVRLSSIRPDGPIPSATTWLLQIRGFTG